MHASSFVGYRNDDVAHADGALVGAFEKMAGSDGLCADLVIDLPDAAPGIEQRRRIYRFRAGKDRFLVEDQRAMDDVVFLNGFDGLANGADRRHEFAGYPGSAEFFG